MELLVTDGGANTGCLMQIFRQGWGELGGVGALGVSLGQLRLLALSKMSALFLKFQGSLLCPIRTPSCSPIPLVPLSLIGSFPCFPLPYSPSPLFPLCIFSLCLFLFPLYNPLPPPSPLPYYPSTLLSLPLSRSALFSLGLISLLSVAARGGILNTSRASDQAYFAFVYPQHGRKHARSNARTHNLAVCLDAFLPACLCILDVYMCVCQCTCMSICLLVYAHLHPHPIFAHSHALTRVHTVLSWLLALT